MASSLSTFIAHARTKGMDHQTIRMILLSAGWKEKDVSQALASESLDVAVPMPPDAGSARDAFFHLLSFTTLTSSVVSVVFLVFDFLNRLFPDPAFPVYGDNLSSVRWELAILIVSFPLFLWMSRLLQKEFAHHPEKLASGVRRWLTYLILFVTACTLVGDLIALIFSLLQGEITLRFILKVLALFVLAGLPFTYYLHVLRLSAERYTKDPIHKMYLIVSSVIVIGVVVCAFFVTGSPLRGRAERFDEQRLTDLRTIHSEILNIAWDKQPYQRPEPVTDLPQPLPANLDEVAANAVYQKISTTDPETSEPYEYRITSNTTYDLCATFSLPRDQEFDIFWNHPVGRHCYSIDALDVNVR